MQHDDSPIFGGNKTHAGCESKARAKPNRNAERYKTNVCRLQTVKRIKKEMRYRGGSTARRTMPNEQAMETLTPLPVVNIKGLRRNNNTATSLSWLRRRENSRRKCWLN